MGPTINKPSATAISRGDPIRDRKASVPKPPSRARPSRPPRIDLLSLMVGCTRIPVQLSGRILPHGKSLNEFPSKRLPPDRLSSRRQSSRTLSLTSNQSLLHDQSHASAGARIPTELFDDILFHVGSHYSSLDIEWKDIAACSLVCRHWANQCRRYMFSGVTLYITSPMQAEMFVKYATRGCPVLIPVHTLIRNIEVEQRYDGLHSFCRHLHIFKSRLGGQFTKLMLSGPVPAGFPSYQLDTPHWGHPYTIATPPSLLPYPEILVRHIHLPSFAHVAKYIRHFECPYKLSFDHLTWDDGGIAPHPFPRRNFRKLGEKNGSTYTVSGCTDNSGLCLHIAMTHRRSLLHMLDDNERQWSIILLQQLHGSFSHIKSNPPESCHWVNTVTGEYCRVTYTWIICSTTPHLRLMVSTATETPTGPVEAKISTMIRDIHKAWVLSFTLKVEGSWSVPQDLSASSNTHVVGLEVWLGWESRDEEDFQVDINRLFSYLRPFTMLRVVVLSFWSYGHLSRVMKHYRPDVSTTDPEIDDGRQYIFAFRRQEEDHKSLQIPGSYDDWVGIDPVTLSLTGQSWSDTDDIVRPLLAKSRAR